MRGLCIMILLVAGAVAGGGNEIAIPAMNAGGVSASDEARASTNYRITDSLGLFAGTACASTNYRIEHGAWASEPRIETDVCLSPAKTYPDGVLFRFTGKVSTAGTDAFDKRFYVEEIDQSSALQVRYGISTGPTVKAGYSVEATGRLATIDDERVLELPYVKVISENETPAEPVFMLSRDAGGEALNEYTPGVWLGRGPYNIGLLVRMFGDVVYKDPGGTFFYLDDGSGIDDGVCLGIRVMCTGLATGNTITPPALGKYVSVYGIVSTTIPSSQPVRCLRPRTKYDILVIPRHP